jgi:hypothetical protein
MLLDWNQEVLLFLVVALVVAFDGAKAAVHWLQDRHRQRGLPAFLAGPLYRLRLLDPELAPRPSPARPSAAT